MEHHEGGVGGARRHVLGMSQEREGDRAAVRTTKRPVERLGYSLDEAAAALGVSPSHFKRHIQPHLPVVYTGGRRIYPVHRLKRWLDQNTCEGGRAA